VTIENDVFWGVAQCGLLRIDVLEDHITSFFRVERTIE
jgi:hypothetical protein